MTEPTLNLEGKMHFHMVLADVIFETKRGGVTSHRVQFMTQSPTNEFPGDRIHQLQNSAAGAVHTKIGPGRAEGFKVHDVLFLAITYCGHMTKDEFYGPGQTTEVVTTEAPDTSSMVTPVASNDGDGLTPSSDMASVSDDETPSADNVVPLKRG